MRRAVRTLSGSARATGIVALALLAAQVLAGRALGAELKPYKIGYNNWIGYIALFVAQDKGYFKEEGLDVQTKMFSSPGDGLAPLLTGDLDAHLTTADSVIIALDKAPGQIVNIFMTDTSAGADAILAKNDVATIRDMKGKKVAATVGQCNHLLLEKALERAKLKDSDIDLTNMNADDAGAAFAAGKLDVAVTWEPWITKVSGEKLGHVIFSSKEVPNLILDTLAISRRTASSKPAETRAFVRALERANAFVIAHPEEAAAIGGKAMEQKPEEVLDMLPKVKLYDRTGNRTQMGTKEKAGPAVATALELAKFFKEQKVNETLVDSSSVFDPSYLE